MKLEHCEICDEATGNAGVGDGSIFIEYPDKTVGPLCDACRNTHWVCEKCDQGVYPNSVTFQETHEGCGGTCS